MPASTNCTSATLLPAVSASILPTKGLVLVGDTSLLVGIDFHLQ